MSSGSNPAVTVDMAAQDFTLHHFNPTTPDNCIKCDEEIGF